MKGVRLIRVLDTVEVTAIANVPGLQPRSLYVDGRDFSSVEEVHVHGITAPYFTPISTTRLLVQVPPTLVDSAISDVAVFSSNLTLTERSFLELGVGPKVREVTGVLRLLQTFVRLLFRTGGSNLFHPTTGGGLLRALTKNVHTSAGDVAVAIRKVTSDIIGEQSLYPSIPASERLLSANITNFTEADSLGTVYATVVITTHAGSSAGATISA